MNRRSLSTAPATPITGGQIRACSISAERIVALPLSAIDANLGEVIAAAVRDEFVRQSRPGGLLRRGPHG